MELQAEGEGNPCTCGPGTAPSQAPGDSEGDPPSGWPPPLDASRSTRSPWEKNRQAAKKGYFVTINYLHFDFFSFHLLSLLQHFLLQGQIVRLQ